MSNLSLFPSLHCAATPYQPSSDTSRDAAQRAQGFADTQEARVAGYILGCGARGATQKDIAEGLFLGRPSVAARCNALARHVDPLKRIVKTSARRDGCAVYVAMVYATGGEA